MNYLAELENEYLAVKRENALESILNAWSGDKD